MRKILLGGALLSFLILNACQSPVSVDNKNFDIKGTSRSNIRGNYT